MDTQVLNSLGWFLTFLIAGIGIAFVLFLALREIVLWYFRINQIADDLHVIATHYRRIAAAETQQRTGIKPQPTATKATGGVGSPFASMR